MNYLNLSGDLDPRAIYSFGILDNWILIIGFIIVGVGLTVLQTVQYTHKRNMSRYEFLVKNSQTLSEIDDLNELDALTKRYLAKLTRTIAKGFIKSSSSSNVQVGNHLMLATHKLKKGYLLSTDDQKLLKEYWSSALAQLLLINGL